MTDIDLSQINSLPSAAHPLGTDYMGRDLVSRLYLAVLHEVIPLWSSCLLACGLGMFCGLVVTAYYDRRLGKVLLQKLMALNAVVNAAPYVIGAFAVAWLFERIDFSAVVLTLMVFVYLKSCFLILELFLQDQALGYWRASYALGARSFTTAWRHGVLSRWRRVLLDHLGFMLKTVLIAEVALCYLGFGMQEPQSSMGNILAGHFNLYMHGNFWVLVVTGCFFMLLCNLPAYLLLALNSIFSRVSTSAGKAFSKGS